MYEVTQLSNGTRIATAHMPQMASVSLGIWSGSGSRHESASLNGVSHFIEHVLFKGTSRRNAKEISESVEGIGGYLNAFTSEENTCYYAKARADKWEILADVLMDMYLNPSFDRDEVEKEREVIREELAMYLDQPSQHVLELLNEVLWPNHPLGRCITGTNSSIDRLKAGDLRRYWKKHYVSSNTIIVLAGPLEHQTVVKKLSKYARRITQGKLPGWKPIKLIQHSPQFQIRPKHSEQIHLAFGIKTSSRHDEHRYSLRLLNTMLGENMSSRLFQRLREDHGLAYSVYSNLGFFDDTGFLTIAAGIDATHLEKSMELIHDTLLEFCRKKPLRKELNQARDYLIGQLDLHLENTENHMIWLGEQILGFGKPFPSSLIRERLMAVTGEEVNRTANLFFKPEHLNLAIVGKVAKKRIQVLQNWLQ